ncbi:MAG: 50S ribosomal protein L5 [Planctomycetota bacterium]
MARLIERYRNEIRPKLKERFGYDNTHQIPEIQKITVSMGVGKAIENKARMDAALADLGLITGQKPVVRRARTSISQFRLRQGYPVGAMVTLRGKRMYEFLDRIITVVIPRLRDFRGVPRKLDGRGNYSLGFSEQLVFPEINLDKVQFIQGMNISISTTAGTDAEGLALLQEFGMPFVRD